ncbi:MAG: DNA polymerase III subunit epsilon [Betaproteobacteria bacterium]|jgi:DNA polymerase III subunit epsilon|nr:DNA polymerase III subunit epsilon [Betaproteobacteria bacterium]NBT11171.1 DNA polymerase III subunit epsilon [Betaproteobacteria bacterium]NBU50153.1 DNA polymerase III subunit epsilon [Betaproteobacteria bacterium]NBX95583.1 DNA polymerase III subunit epsilon [Betaproteobacteria bacterium]
MRQVFLDTETTGLSPEAGDRVIEIGCIEMVNRRLTGRNRHYYLNPERSSSAQALEVHGLTDEFLADKPRFVEVVDEWMAWLEGAEVIIHNASFDTHFLDHELKRVGRGPFASHVNGVRDSLLMARELFPGKRNSLDALCARLGVDNSNRTLHGALLDAGLLAEVFIRMTRGQESLVIEQGASASSASGLAPSADFHLSGIPVLLVSPDDQEQAEHARVLEELDKASGGKTVWRELV